MGNRVIHLEVENEFIRGAGVVIGAAGSHDDVELELRFSDVWHGTSRKIVWFDALGERSVVTALTASLLVSGETEVYRVPVPAEAKAVEGDMCLTIRGVNTAGNVETRAVVAATARFRVLPAIWDPLAAESGEVSPSVSDQLQQEIEQIKGDIADAAAAADAKEAAEAAAAMAAAAASAASGASSSAAESASAAAGGASAAAGSAAAASQSALEAKQYSGRPPVIRSGTWWTWNASAGAYEDTGSPARGARGETGAQGDKGETGAQGPKGDTGDRGPKGDKGAQGEKGDTGDRGPAGATGPTGPRGATGPQGEIGPAGPRGATGATGATGPRGPAGADGRSFAVKGLYATLPALQAVHPTGAEGDAYAVGTAEDNTVYLWDVDRGDWADVGPLQGPPGPQGETGPAGPAGPVGAQGPAGPAGPAGQAADVIGDGRNIDITDEGEQRKVSLRSSIRIDKAMFGTRSGGMDIEATNDENNLTISGGSNSGYCSKIDISVDKIELSTVNFGPAEPARLCGVAAPTGDNDAANKQYVDGALAGLSTEGAILSSGETIIAKPVLLSDGEENGVFLRPEILSEGSRGILVTPIGLEGKFYSLRNGYWGSGNIIVSPGITIKDGAGIIVGSVTTQEYVATELAKKMSLTDGTMTGPLSVQTPTASAHAASKGYVDAACKRVYSSTEKEIGTWPDGRPVFAQTFAQVMEDGELISSSGVRVPYYIFSFMPSSIQLISANIMAHGTDCNEAPVSFSFGGWSEPCKVVVLEGNRVCLITKEFPMAFYDGMIVLEDTNCIDAVTIEYVKTA